MATPLDDLLGELCSCTELPVGSSLHNLSNLEAAGVASLRAAWSQISTEVRRHMMTRLVEMAEADFEMDFGGVFRLGLTDEDPEVRLAAIEGLWEDEDVRLVPALIDRLTSEQASEVRAAAATSLGRFILLGELDKIRPKPYQLAYTALLHTCQSQDESLEVRRRAMESLSYVCDDQVIGLIESAFGASEERMRVSAVFAMGRSNDRRWSRHVQGELFNPNPELRYEAARACGELQLTDAVVDLEELTEDVDAEVQEATLWALGQIGGAKARQILLRFADSDSEATRSAAEAALNELEFLHGRALLDGHRVEALLPVG